MEFYKKWWFWIIIILALLIFFFPKSCGGGGGTDGPVTSIDCSCVGIKGPSLFVLLGGRITDASPTSCYGVCLKSTCETTIIYPNETKVTK